jgi:phosphatidylglycerol:prolipoprotein diacylglycerol transferase
MNTYLEIPFILGIVAKRFDKPAVREVLIDIPGAQVLAGVAAGVAILFALYYAVLSGKKDEKGERRPLQIGPMSVSLIIAFALIGGVVMNKEFAEKTIPIYSYGFMVMLGFAMAILVSSLRAEQAGIDINVILDLGLWTMLAGIAGARIFYMIQYPIPGQGVLKFFEVWKGGLVFYGGLIGGTVAGIAFVRMKGIKIMRIADVIAPAIPLGISFARFGCFLNGCCFGGRCSPDYPFALEVKVLNPSSPGVFDVAYLHPAQLYSSLDAFVIFVLVVLYGRLTFKKRINGEVFWVSLILYSIGRFSMEILRNDTPDVFGTNMTIAQVISLCIIAVAVPAFVWAQVLKRKGLGAPVSGQEQEEPAKEGLKGQE